MALGAWAIAGCSAPEQCMEHSSAQYKEGLAKILAKTGVTASLRKDKGLCFAKRDAQRVNAAGDEAAES